MENAIEVSFYNKRHKDLLKANSPKYDKIEEITESGLTLDEDLWIYCLFREQKNRDGFRTYNDFKLRLARRIQYLEDYLDLKSNTITAIDDIPEKPISEYVGVGGALKLISEVHGLIEADWEIIPESQTKDLDFFIASDGNNIIEVECKGTLNRASRSSMKRDIEEKKEVQRNKEKNNHILYGVITSFYSDKNKKAQIDILDPDPFFLYEDPFKVKLINRLKYYLFHFNIFTKSHFLISLSERINILREINDYKSLDGIPLVNRYGEAFEIPSSLNWKKHFKDHDSILGDITPIDKESYLFYGVDVSIVEKLISQNYDEIMGYKDYAKTTLLSTEIKVVPKDYILYEKSFLAEKTPELVSLQGKISRNSAGRISGLMKRI